MKLFSPQNIVAVLVVLAAPFVAYAQFTGPESYCGSSTAADPKICNVPGPLWLNMTGTGQSGIIKLSSGNQFQVNSGTSSTYAFGNYGGLGGALNPFTLNISGGVNVDSLPASVGLLGDDGRVQAKRFCFAPGGTNDCVDKFGAGSTWTSLFAGSGGTLTGITAGSGITVSGAAPSPTVSLDTAFSDGRYVQKTGDTMSGTLTINTPSTYAVNATAPSGSVFTSPTSGVTTNIAYSGYGVYTNGYIWAQNNILSQSNIAANGNINGATLNGTYVNASANLTAGGTATVNALIAGTSSTAGTFTGSVYGIDTKTSTAGSGTAIRGSNGAIGGDFTGSTYGVNAMTQTAGVGTAVQGSNGQYGAKFSGSYAASYNSGGSYGAFNIGSINGTYSVGSSAGGLFYDGAYSIYTYLSDSSGNGVKTSGSVTLDGNNGVKEAGADYPMLTRGWDPFGGTAPAKYQGLGRWGMFMEPFTLTMGIPDTSAGTRYFAVVKYDTAGNRTNLFYTDNSGNFVVPGGTASKPGGGSWAVYSDARLKDVHGNFSRGLSDLMSINPVSYNYKSNNALSLPSDKTYIGVVAQDVQKAIPEAVSTNKDGYLEVNNDPIIWTMVNSIKELKSENDALKAENDSIKARLDAIEAKLNK